MLTSELSSRFDDVLTRLLAKTSATRTTLRLDDAKLGFHVDDVVGEARREGAKSLRGQTVMNQRELTTVQWLECERRALIQGDLSKTDVPPPPPLVAIYGVTAQMLGPVIRNDGLQGWVSVHFCDGPRIWSENDVTALNGAVAEVSALLDEVDAS